MLEKEEETQEVEAKREKSRAIFIILSSSCKN
jgi:hypothetical protein